jgi:putative heme-binding domain-containing protein
VKPDVLGAIYRIRRTGAPRAADPRGLTLPWGKIGPAQLTQLLADSRPAVRRRASFALANAGPTVVVSLSGGLQANRSAAVRREIVWAATRVDRPQGRAVVRRALGDSDETVRQAALHSVSLWRDHEASAQLIGLLQSDSWHNRRAAGEALGRLGAPAAVTALLAATALPADRFLEHAFTYALIEIGDGPGTAVGLRSANPVTRRIALTALDQMGGKHLAAEVVAAELNASDSRLKETAWWIVGRHPEWGGKLSGILRERLAAIDPKSAESADLVQQLARLAKAAATQELLAERLRDEQASAGARRLVLRAMAQASLREAPDTWVSALTGALARGDIELTREAVATARALRVPVKRADALMAALSKLGADAAAPANVRLGALAALPSGLPAVEPALFAFLSEQVKPEQPVAARSLAADVLARARLSSAQLVSLAGIIRTAGPMEANRLLEAFVQTKDDSVGRSLIGALSESSARAALPAETLRLRVAPFGPEVRKLAEPLLASLNVDVAKQKAHLDDLLATISEGDVRRGQAVFNNPKAACASCHAIGYLGGKVGPDLTRIGGIRSERDLLEAILFPSASFVRGYEPVTITTRAGKVVNGLPRKDTAEEVVLVTGADQETRIPREEIDEMLPGRVSVMPAGLDQQLSRRDLADLVMFLKACK